MSSGSYFPPPVRTVEIPKAGGSGVRVLGVPTVADRIAQTVAAMVSGTGSGERFSTLIPMVIGRAVVRWTRSAHAGKGVGVPTGSLIWTSRGSSTILIMNSSFGAVAHHTDLPWALLYVQRWLTAPVQRPDGTLIGRDRGSPQGSAISPLLANLFMHYAFDAWMAREFPAIKFERYCDDVVVHCRTEAMAHRVREATSDRLAECGGLLLHPVKTRVVYCKDCTQAWLG